MADDRPQIVKGKVAWTVNIGCPVAAPPEEVFAAWVDGDTFAEITGKPAKGTIAAGAERAMWDGFASGSIVEIEAPRRVLELWRSKDFPKDAKDSVLEVSFDKKDAGTMINIRQWGFAKAPGRPLNYETMMFWSQKVFEAFRVHYLARGDAPAQRALPPSGPERDRLEASLANDADALDAWIANLAPFGEPVLLRACIGAARVAMPVWTAGESEGSSDFRDVVAGFGTEGGAPPADILAALEAYLAEPSRKKRSAAVATLDPTAQLRFTDEEMGDLSEIRWAYALEAARCGAYALEPKADLATEARLSAESATKALGGTKDREAAVRAAIRKELEEWLAS